MGCLTYVVTDIRKGNKMFATTPEITRAVMIEKRHEAKRHSRGYTSSRAARVAEARVTSQPSKRLIWFSRRRSVTQTG